MIFKDELYDDKSWYKDKFKPGRIYALKYSFFMKMTIIIRAIFEAVEGGGEREKG